MPYAQAPQPPCIIHYDQGNQTAVLTAAYNGPNIKGANYQFQIVSSSTAGTSSNMQGGAVNAEANRPAVLSSVTLSSGEGTWSAQLQIYDAKGNLVCRANLP